MYLYVLWLVESESCDISENIAYLRGNHDQHQYHPDTHVQRECAKVDILRRYNYLLIVSSIKKKNVFSSIIS